MSCFEIDHCFVMCRRGAPEAKLLTDVGLVEGPPNRHPGQGTANRRFYFSNAMLELLWIEYEAEARSLPAAKLRLLERSKWRANATSPFGVCLRPSPGTATSEVPFPGWSYQPLYLPTNKQILIGANSDRINEPLAFYLSFAGRPAGSSWQPIAFKAVQSISIGCLLKDRSEVADALARIAGFSLQHSKEPWMELRFSNQGKSVDLRPDLPIIFKT